ncbi:MAG: putative DNA binding domain-containing protein [Albidovulum sp.]|nr:putative DNA binding domain-containing protein [Albidovulum sp.]MDE0306447.1 putative DNA binding domain-containing protein [Albidovulum sp.]MDE0531164.1 putative DNA binding domain-containing protein [Albidovulum sp.]
MITRSDLLEIIANGENSGVEFKRDCLRSQDLAKELVAFSNLDGGMVLLGVEDNGRVSGLTRVEIEEWVMNVCRDKIRPAIVPFFEIIGNVEHENAVGIVRVTRGYDVHALRRNNANKYLIRVGSQSREATTEELARLFQRKGSLRAELQPVSGAALAHLDLRRLRNYFNRIRQQDVPNNEDAVGWQSLLSNTEVMTDEEVTVCGLPLFGKTPNRFLPHAGIDAVAYVEREQHFDARERITLRGPMTPLLDENNSIVENGLVEQALEFVKRNTRQATDLDGGRRMESFVYPSEVLREGVVNALIHRDYLLASTDISLSVFSDRLEIVSPGRLPNGIAPARMRAGTRSARNQILKDILRDYGYLEHMGMGVSRKIITGMKEHNGSDSELIEENERFMVRLFA